MQYTIYVAFRIEKRLEGSLIMVDNAYSPSIAFSAGKVFYLDDENFERVKKGGDEYVILPKDSYIILSEELFDFGLIAPDEVSVGSRVDLHMDIYEALFYDPVAFTAEIIHRFREIDGDHSYLEVLTEWTETWDSGIPFGDPELICTFEKVVLPKG